MNVSDANTPFMDLMRKWCADAPDDVPMPIPQATMDSLDDLVTMLDLPRVTDSVLDQMARELYASVADTPMLLLVDHGRGCIDAPVDEPITIGDSVRVRLEINGTFAQCRPGIVTHLNGHVPECPIYVDFGTMGAWFQRDRVSLDQEAVK